MDTLLKRLQKLASEALVFLFSEQLDPSFLEAEVTPSTAPQFGHYQCNSALKISKALKTNPRTVAEQIAAFFRKESLFSKVEVAGPGFINLTLHTDFLSQGIKTILSDARLGVPLAHPAQKVVIDFSSPNVAKELHVGHLRSTIIGDCLARVFEFLGHDVLRLNHIGDWGTQFGMLIAYIKENPCDLSASTLSTLMQWYRAAKKCFDADPDFKKRAHGEVVRLQSGDPDSLRTWESICAVSRKGFQEIYDLLDVRLSERGESFYNPYLSEIVQDLTQRGCLEVSDGAKCIFLEGFISREGTPLPMIIQKADGGYNYDTTDLAALRYRVQVDHADRIIYITDAGQALHFDMLFKAAEKVGYVDPSKVRLDHVPFGVVLGPDGKKFKTRSGETEKFIDLILEAVKQATNIMRERLPEASEQEILKSGSILGIDAIKYADLSSHRIKDYVFSYERMLKFEGNTAAFLLYAYVRILGIKRKVAKTLDMTAPLILEHPSEISLALHLEQFPETLDMMSRELLPNRLAEYLYTLAEMFHAFFRDCRVEGSHEEAGRLLLIEAAERVLAKGLEILGLRTLDRM